MALNESVAGDPGGRRPILGVLWIAYGILQRQLSCRWCAAYWGFWRVWHSSEVNSRHACLAFWRRSFRFLKCRSERPWGFILSSFCFGVTDFSRQVNSFVRISSRAASANQTSVWEFE